MFARNGIAALRGTLFATTLVVALAVAGVAAAEPASPAAGLPPHVATETDTDTCAMCHRGHTSASSATWRTLVDSQTVGNALLTGTGTSDVGMCYACHGVDALGSGVDVQTPFEETSHHALEPETSPYGPSPKQCSSCHDTHGVARVATGTPYPSLLRSFDPQGNPSYQGNAYCATCHLDRPMDTWDGLAIWNQTAHAQLPAPSDTLIVCLDCHEAHGSSVPPLLRTELTPPSAPSTSSVAANDRAFCEDCHPVSSATWDGPALYATSSHGSTTATVDVAGEWPSAGATRLAGECQSCHAPMGRNDGSGQAVPKLANALGRSLCDSCHRSTGPASTDMAALAYPPSSAPEPELIAGFGASAGLSAYGRLCALHARNERDRPARARRTA